MLRLPTPTKVFKVKINTSWMKKEWGFYFEEMVGHPTTKNIMTYQIDIADLIEPYKRLHGFF
jgi:hypothetical protein